MLALDKIAALVLESTSTRFVPPSLFSRPSTDSINRKSTTSSSPCSSPRPKPAPSETYVPLSLPSMLLLLTRAPPQPWEDSTSFGPLISSVQQEKVLAYIASGIAEGATVACGGKAWSGSKGFYVEPTILTECTSSMKVVREEIFGPVLVVTKFKTEEEALKLANDSAYGLGAAVFTGEYILS